MWAGLLHLQQGQLDRLLLVRNEQLKKKIFDYSLFIVSWSKHVPGLLPSILLLLLPTMWSGDPVPTSTSKVGLFCDGEYTKF